MKLKKLAMLAIAAAMTLSLGGDAQAQPGRGGGPGFGGPGFGGPGFGGPGFGGGFGGGDLLGLLGREEVRKELNFEDDQLAGLEKLRERLPRPERPDFDFRNATEQQRNEFMAKMQAQAAERAEVVKENLEELLLPNQLERLEQISIQQMGIRALLNADVASKLAISDEVSESLKKAAAENQEKVREAIQAAMGERGGRRDGQGGPRDGQGGPERGGEVREQMEKLRGEGEAALLALLTDEQKAKFAELKGAPFELAAPQGRGFGGPGFGGGREGDGRRGEGRGGEGRRDGGQRRGDR